MPAKNHPFAAKSPAEKAAAIRPADAWPATAVGWRATDGKLLLTVTHHEANAPVEAFAADDNMLGAVCLLWSVATGSLPALDAATLVQRDPNHQWSTYQSAMHDLVTFLASAPADAAQDLQQRAAAHVAPYGDFLRAVSPDAFLQLLAWDEDLKRPVHRIPLLHWLLTWQAQHNRSTLRCQIVADDKTQLPAPCPLSLQQWNAELTRHKSALTFPGILSRIAIKRAELSNPSGSTEPLWRRMLTRPDQLSASVDFTADIDAWRAPPMTGPSTLLKLYASCALTLPSPTPPWPPCGRSGRPGPLPLPSKQFGWPPAPACGQPYRPTSPTSSPPWRNNTAQPAWRLHASTPSPPWTPLSNVPPSAPGWYGPTSRQPCLQSSPQ